MGDEMSLVNLRINTWTGIYKIAGTKGECGVGVEMKWVHLRIADHILCLSFSNGRVLTETAAKNPLP